MKIIVNLNTILLPSTRFDFSAHIDGDEPDDDGRMIVGWGRTKREAVEELFDALDEREDAEAARLAQEAFDKEEISVIEVTPRGITFIYDPKDGLTMDERIKKAEDDFDSPYDVSMLFRHD